MQTYKSYLKAQLKTLKASVVNKTIYRFTFSLEFAHLSCFA